MNGTSRHVLPALEDRDLFEEMDERSILVNFLQTNRLSQDFSQLFLDENDHPMVALDVQDPTHL